MRQDKGRVDLAELRKQMMIPGGGETVRGGVGSAEIEL